MNTDVLSAPADCQIVTTRIVNAPIDFVFRAWTEPQHLQNWWGPAGFTNTFNEFDLKPGGRWSFIMHGPEKGNYVNECEFIKIEKLVLIAWNRLSKPLFKVVASFEELDPSRTKVIFRMLFETPDECEKLKRYVPDKNEENMDKLEMELNKMISQVV